MTDRGSILRCNHQGTIVTFHDECKHLLSKVAGDEHHRHMLSCLLACFSAQVMLLGHTVNNGSVFFYLEKF